MKETKEDAEFSKIQTKITAIEVIDCVDGKFVKRRINAPENTDLTPKNIDKLIKPK